MAISSKDWKNKWLRAQDLVNGAEGWAYLTVDGDNQDLFEIKKLDATLKLEKHDVYTLGHRGKQEKVVGWEGSGTMDVYYVSSKVRELFNNYIQNGLVALFNILVVNEDPASSIGQQAVILKDCLLDEVSAAKLDVSAKELEDNYKFTFTDYQILSSFNKPNISH